MKAFPRKLSEWQFNRTFLQLIAKSQAGDFGRDDFGRGPQVWPPRGSGGRWELRWGQPSNALLRRFGNELAVEIGEQP